MRKWVLIGKLFFGLFIKIFKIHNRFFRLLAKGVVNLEKLMTSGSLKYQVDLMDSFGNKIESVKK
jgi:hypothetical protein